MSAAETAARSPRPEPGSAASLITITVSAASALLALHARQIVEQAQGRPLLYLAFAGLCLVLTVTAVDVYGKGTLSFAGTGLVACGMLLGAGPAMTAAALTAALLYVRTVRLGAKLHRSVFNAANFVLSAACATFVYEAAGGTHGRAVLGDLGPAFAAGVVYCVVNLGLLCLAMGTAEGTPPLRIFTERFRWMVPHYLASGPLALAIITAYQHEGILGLFAFVLPPLMMMLSVHQYVGRTRRSVEEVREVNRELQEAVTDLRALFDFSGGLAARAHDRGQLVSYVEQSLQRMTGGRARLFEDPRSGEIELRAAGNAVGSLQLVETAAFDAARWERLSEAVLPQLTTALESVGLIDEVQRKHMATIAALSRSMEAKDSYTGGHTARVSDGAVAIAARLGFSGADLDAIAVGALLHDIGKIGVPERILHKPGPLNDAEWSVVKEHPLISERILSGIGLSPIVIEIARSSHERMDGAGYPDGLAGEEIPLPARIVLVADAFDALTSDRPYRPGRSVRAAIDEITAHSGTQFYPRAVDVLAAIYREEPRVLGLGALRAVDAA
jgi:putative nucleotidyltransferase with HDIG domain